jgi:hypothetical protein
MKSKIAVKKLKNEIRKAGFEPTWELFERTFGWFQFKKKSTLEEQEKIKKLWDSVK